MAQNPLHHLGASSEDDDRRSRFAPSTGLDGVGTEGFGRGGGGGVPIGNGGAAGGGPPSLRERAASQPPHSSDQTFLSSPSTAHFVPSSSFTSGGGGGNAWPSPGSRFVSGPNRGNQPIPIRSSSFSSTSQSQFSSAMRDRVFPSMIEDEESEWSETYDHEQYVPPSLGRGRSYGQDPTRSRSQSLATGRPGAIGAAYLGSAMNSWNDSLLSNNNTSNPLAIPGRYGDIKPPGASRYGSLGTLGRSPSSFLSSSPSNNLLGNGLNSNRVTETNQSPFRRDVGQILLDDGSAFRELWNPPRDENVGVGVGIGGGVGVGGGGGGGSGTTSRRHSVSVVQPRKGNIIGFNAPGVDVPEEPSRTTTTAYSRSNLKFSDDDLVGDLGLLELGPNDQHQHHHPPSLSSSSTHPPSQPASLPIYAPLSRNPPPRDLLSPYQSINLNIPNSYVVPRQQPSIGTPSESEFSAGRDSPGRTSHYEQIHHHQYGGQQQDSARFIPGQGFKYPNAGGGGGTQVPYLRNREPSFSGPNVPPGLNPSPISPTTGGSRMINPQQQPFFPQQLQRRPSEPPTPLSATSTGTSQPPSASTNLNNPQLPLHDRQSSSSSQQVTHQPSLNDLGKGVPLHSVPSSCPLFIVEFKAGRTDLFYLTDLGLNVKVGDMVIVEADRGKDLGTVVNDTITIGEVEAWQRQQVEKAVAAAAATAAAIGYGMEGPMSPGGGGSQGGGGAGGAGGQGQGQQQQGKKEINPKMILGKAGQQDHAMMVAKAQDEMKALQLCQSKVKAKKLPMEVIDAEYQWDRRKLTFYFIAEKRIDFRELVRELFRLYKTRIWMASIQGGISYEQ